MGKELNNRTAIITGAGSGIGKAVALLMAAEGANIVVSDISDENGKEAVEELKQKGGKAIFVKADSSSPKDNEALVAAAVKEFGNLHIAVNNAGIGGPIGPTGEYPIEGWQKVIDINLSGVFYGMRYQIPAMLKAGGGSIVNISSILGQAGTKGSSAYVAAKHGVVGLTKAAALDHAAQKIRINAVGPGYVNTPLLTGMEDDARKALLGLHPIGRLGESEEIAELVLWLASDKASFVTGSYYAADGGYLAQ